MSCFGLLPQDKRIFGVVGLFGMIIVGHLIVGLEQTLLCFDKFCLVSAIRQCIHQIHQTCCAQVLVLLAVCCYPPKLMHRLNIMRNPVSMSDEQSKVVFVVGMLQVRKWRVVDYFVAFIIGCLTYPCAVVTLYGKK